MTESVDVVVLGAGAAGMTAALVAAAEGLRVMLVEKTDQVGGTSSRSAGTLWIPGNFTMSAAAADIDINAARRYLDALVGERSPADVREAFLRAGRAMLEYLRDRAGLRFKACPRHADYHPELAGAARGGRPVEPEVFDGRRLQPHFATLRPPIAEFMLFGGMMVSKADIDCLLNAGRTFADTQHALSLVSRYLADRLSHRRGTRLTMGNALCAGLLEGSFKHGVRLCLQTTTTAIEGASDGTWQVLFVNARRQTQVIRTDSVIFAGGGFSGNAAWREQHLPTPVPTQTVAFEGADGSSIAQALSLGATLGDPHEHNAWWFPSSTVRRADGSIGVFPHIVLDRAKPGLIAVDAKGRRFVNEGVSYHAFARAQYANGAVPCWLICDTVFIRRYGLGVVRPGGFGRRRAVGCGDIVTASTIERLARRIGVDPAGLAESARRMSRYAVTGCDPDFGKGADPLSRQNGDAARGLPNPCLGAIATAPFYAVRVAPADLGTSRGVQTDTNARLLDLNGEVLPGLYACGNDMQSIMGGQYPAPGVTLGPGMTFGYLAALDCKRRNLVR